MVTCDCGDCDRVACGCEPAPPTSAELKSGVNDLIDALYRERDEMVDTIAKQAEKLETLAHVEAHRAKLAAWTKDLQHAHTAIRDALGAGLDDSRLTRSMRSRQSGIAPKWSETHGGLAALASPHKSTTSKTRTTTLQKRPATQTAKIRELKKINAVLKMLNDSQARTIAKYRTRRS